MMQTEKPDTPQKHRRFLLFGGVEHYPAGGMHDLLFSHDTIDEARQHAEDLVRDGYVPPGARTGWPVEWWHIFDSDFGEVVAARFEE